MLNLRFPDLDPAEFENTINLEKTIFTSRIYPQHEQSDEEVITHRLVPHLDTSLVILENQMTAHCSFQVLFGETGDDQKIPVPGIRNDYLVFIGQSFSFLTKNYLPSVLHVVDKPSEQFLEGSRRSSLITLYEPVAIIIPFKNVNPHHDETTVSCLFVDSIGLNVNDL